MWCGRVLRGEAAMTEILKIYREDIRRGIQHRSNPRQLLPGTTALIDKLNIRDEAALNKAEALATCINAFKLEQYPLEGVLIFSIARPSIISFF